MIDKKSFCELLESSKKYHKMVDKLQDALGGIILDPFYDLTQTLYNYFERESGFKWDDDLWDIVYDEKTSSEEVYNEIMKKIEENRDERNKNQPDSYFC